MELPTTVRFIQAAPNEWFFGYLTIPSANSKDFVMKRTGGFNVSKVARVQKGVEADVT
jgi:hypothetical protein